MKILTPFALIGSINAAILGTRSPLERRATQFCHAKYHGLFASYSVWIGVPYGSQSCDDTYNNIEFPGGNEPVGCAISNWQCVEASDGNTQLWFNTGQGNELYLNACLETAYPAVNTFNCPGC